MRIVISSGHGKYVRGAEGPSPWGLDEVDEARDVVDNLKDILTLAGVECVTFHDDTSHDQNTNLHTIVDFHNSLERQLDISVHFNAYQETDKGMGTECLYLTQSDLAARVAQKISLASGLINRGAKKRTDLYFLNNTEAPAILIEVCFVDSKTDCNIYDDQFENICAAITDAVIGEEESEVAERTEWRFSAQGTMSTFGGPTDMGVSETEGLALCEPSEMDEFPDELFLSEEEAGAPGLARRLNPSYWPGYIACRWQYEITDRDWLQDHTVTVRNSKTGVTVRGVQPIDWGPHEEKTGRMADLSPGLAERLGLTTDDICEVILPIPKQEDV